MAPETTVVAAAVAPTVNPVVSFENGESPFPKSDGPMPAVAEPELAEESSSFPEQYVLLAAVPAAEIEAELDEKAVAVPAVVSNLNGAAGNPQLLKAERWEVRLVSKAASGLRRAFPQKPRFRVINELLDGFLKERQARERLNLNHWPEYGQRFLEGLAERWKVQEGNRLAAIPTFLMAKRKEVLRRALAITDNLPDAEAAVAESDLEYLTGAVEDEFYPLAVSRNAVDIVRQRQNGQDAFVPLERAFEVGDDCAAGEDEDIEGHCRFSSEPSAAGCDAKDPLQILVDRRNRHLARTRKSKAKKRARTRRKYKWIRRKLWGQKLKIGPKNGTEMTRSFDY
jgi:hypothetical protein